MLSFLTGRAGFCEKPDSTFSPGALKARFSNLWPCARCRVKPCPADTECSAQKAEWHLILDQKSVISWRIASGKTQAVRPLERFQPNQGRFDDHDFVQMPGRNASAMQASCAASDAAAEQRRIKSAVSYRSDLFEFPESICPCSFSPETSLRPDHGARTASPYAPRPDKKFRR